MKQEEETYVSDKIGNCDYSYYMTTTTSTNNTTTTTNFTFNSGSSAHCNNEHNKKPNKQKNS